MGIYRRVSRPQGKNPHRIFDSTGIVNILGLREVKQGKETKWNTIKGVTNQNIG